MYQSLQDKIETERNMNQMGLEQFVENLNLNDFSQIVFDQTEIIQNEINKIIKEFSEKHENPTSEDVFYLHSDTVDLETKLSALSEMNIVYAFREFEINIKRIISATYEITTKELYQWESIKNFLKSKNIILSTITGFDEVNQLRLLNNFIKHSSSKELSAQIKGIPEFTSLSHFDSESLTGFYNRIKLSPRKFLEHLCNLIYNDLYVFDEDRLESIAKKMAVRMDKGTASIFIEKLKELY
jgi:hypothetical protein